MHANATLAICMLFPLLAGCAGFVNSAAAENTFTLKGNVRVTGNEPFIRLVLTVPSAENNSSPQDHLIQGLLAKELREQYQGRTVTVEYVKCPVSVQETALGPSRCIEPIKILGIE